MINVMKAGLLYGVIMAAKEMSEEVIMRLRKAAGREEVRHGVDEFRRSRRRKPSLSVLR